MNHDFYILIVKWLFSIVFSGNNVFWYMPLFKWIIRMHCRRLYKKKQRKLQPKKQQQINKNSKWKPKKIGKKRTSHQRVKQCLLNWYNRCWKSSFIFRPSIKIVPIQLTFGGLLIFRFGCIYFSRHAYFSLAFGWSLPFVVLLFSLNFWSVVAVVLKWMVHYRLESDNIYKGKKKNHNHTSVWIWWSERFLSSD